ncbi:hypothetical protein [Sinomonas sp.]|jgi:hypothetical protein|uniref:hypothetical protein n=1 Tax=Sinomonas sp. TaxID=1914986 RepID=UPI002FDF4445
MVLLVVALLLGGYSAGTVWAHEVDIFRSWPLVGKRFRAVQEAHWRRLPYWVFVPVGLGLVVSAVLVWVHPDGSPVWGIWGSLGCQVLSVALTGGFWGRWQAALAKDPAGARSRYLALILRTHWVRTGLVTANALALWVIVLPG